MKLKTYFMLVLLFWFIAINAQADPDNKKLIDNKQELDQVKRQLGNTRLKIDSLQNLEKELSKTISNYGDQVDRNQRLVDRLGQQLHEVRGELSTSKQDLLLTDDRVNRLRKGYVGLLREYYTRIRSDASVRDWDFEAILNNNRMMRYISAVSTSSTREIVVADNSVRRLEQSVDKLSQTSSEISSLRNEKKSKINLDLTLKEKEESSLSGVRKQTNTLRDRLVSLSEIARQMEDIIAQLEQEQVRRRQAGRDQARFISGSFSTLKGSLKPPIKGRIVSSFGWKTNNTTNLKSFSPGIDIKPSTGHKNIYASSPGRVAYVGSLRGYDNFVIMEHDDGFYTTYAGMASVIVLTDDLIDRGEKLGDCGPGNIHFEIRRGREHLDPVIWLDINEL